MPLTQFPQYFIHFLRTNSDTRSIAWAIGNHFIIIMRKVNPDSIKLVAPCTYEIPIGFVPNMRVPGKFFATPDMAALAFAELQEWNEGDGKSIPSIAQIAYTATLPGISEASFGMADMHSGYGFCIGGVAAFDTTDHNAIVSPGGVGYDINCGVRLMTTNLTREDVEPHLSQLVDELYKQVPVGVGGKRKGFVTKADIRDILKDGAKWAVHRGYGVEEDLELCEEGGCVAYADPQTVSERAVDRGMGTLGTLGAGNHYVEVQEVDEVFDERAAEVMGIHKGQIVLMIHTGSRGLGHQVADDFIKEMEASCDLSALPDKQLASAPFESELGQRYIHAMGAAANFAWCNRQVIMHFAQKAFRNVLKRDDLEMHLVYDVAHNIAKLENHVIDGVEKQFVVHRKGATRAFGPSRREVPAKYREIGQPVLIGGSMGTASYVLVGRDGNPAFGSTCHGAGRTMGRGKAIRELDPDVIKAGLEAKGVKLRAASKKTVVEEASVTYKDVEQVVSACATVGLSAKVARLVPLGVIKG